MSFNRYTSEKFNTPIHIKKALQEKPARPFFMIDVTQLLLGHGTLDHIQAEPSEQDT